MHRKDGLSRQGRPSCSTKGDVERVAGASIGVAVSNATAMTNCSVTAPDVP